MSTTPNNQFEYEGDQAASYEGRRTSETKWRVEQEAVADFLAFAAPKPSRILDVPVGTGRFLEVYAHRGHQAIGIDVSPDMLSQSASKAAQLPDSDISLRVGDITALDIDPNSVAIGVCVRMFNLVDADFVARAMGELARVSTDYLIVGIRSHGRRGAVRRVARRARSAIAGEPHKLIIHSEATVQGIFDSIGATVTKRRLVATGAHHSSKYFIYLLALPS